MLEVKLFFDTINRMKKYSLEQIITFANTHPWVVPCLTLLIIWSAIWKFIALWKAAKHNHLTIFIILAILNTVGIAEIIYIGYLYFKEKKTKITEVIK